MAWRSNEPIGTGRADRGRAVVPGIVLALGAGCSAVIDPDIGRLGSRGDAGVFDGGLLDDGGAGEDASIDDGGGTDPDGGRACSDGCDDGVACTADTCDLDRDVCVSAPDDARCGAGEVCTTAGCRAATCAAAEDCDDGVFCNGDERCDPGARGADARGCVGGAAPCDDGVSCTTDTCDEAGDTCSNAAADDVCDDDVACTVDRCAPGDAPTPDGCLHAPDDSLCQGCLVGATCDPEEGCVGGRDRDCRDADPCTFDRCDEAMGACVHDERDDDEDGFPALRAGDTTCGGSDCDDADPAVFPGADERCDNRIDDDCDGVVNDGCPGQSDRCEDAVAIGAGVSGSFDALTDDVSTACGSSGGRDAFYYVDLPRDSDLMIETAGSASDTVLAASSTCNDTGFRLACNDDAGNGSSASRLYLHHAALDASARVFLMVDGFDASTAGAFVASADGPTPATTDDCVAPLDVSEGGTVLARVDRRFLTTPFVGSCQTFSAGNDREGVFRFTAPGSGQVQLEALSGEFRPIVYVRTACADAGSEIVCETSNNAGGTATAVTEFEAVAGETYFIVVDGADTGDSYRLVVHLD